MALLCLKGLYLVDDMKHSQSQSPKCFLLITTGLGTGGAEAMLMRVVSQLRQEGHHIHVVNLTSLRDHQATLEAQSVTIYNAPLSRPLAAISTLWHVRKQMKSAKPLAIIGWMYLGNLISSLLHLCLPQGPKLIWSVRQSLDFWASEKLSTKCAIWLSRFMSGRVDDVIFNAHFQNANIVNLDLVVKNILL